MAGEFNYLDAGRQSQRAEGGDNGSMSGSPINHARDVAGWKTISRQLSAQRAMPRLFRNAPLYMYQLTPQNAAMPIPGLDLTFAVAASDVREAKEFLNFLRKAARKHSVTISISMNQTQELILSVPGKECWNLDPFLQELILTQGLYYYLCSVSNRRYVARSVVKPIFEELLLSCFSVAYPVLLQKHLLEGSPDWMAGEFTEGTAQLYELLFQRFKLKMVSGYEFIRDLDDLLTEFMLTQLAHTKGDQSPKFNVLVDRCGKQDILRDKRVRKLFNRVHSLRTRGLHRLEREIPDAELSEIAQSVYNVFEWLDDYWKAQDEKTVRLSGRRYRRVRFGQEMRAWERNPFWKQQINKEFRASWIEVIKEPCHDCGVIAGELHLDGCDVEVCPRCAGQYLCCDCRLVDDET